jgi:hypothetical protein
MWFSLGSVIQQVLCIGVLLANANFVCTCAMAALLNRHAQGKISTESSELIFA